MDLKPGSKISHYEICQPLGAGGMGVVYQARDLRLDRMVALKFLPARGDVTEEEHQRLILEARTTSALDHPNICTVFDVEQTPAGEVFIAMAFYEGETLRRRVERGTISVEEACGLMTQICQGLGKAHSHGVVHRDIKPENLILTTDGIVKIVDFGIAKLKGQSRLTRPGSVLGTPAYMSPEQVRGQEVDARSDIWSSGVVFFYLLSGQMPFHGETDFALMYAIVNERHQSPSALRGGIPPRLEAVIDRMLAKSPQDRYQNTQQVLDDLKNPEPVTVGTDSRAGVIAGGIASIAVLPLKELNPGSDASLGEGLAEAIITDLGRLDGLRVISPASVLRVRPEEQSLAEIARTLNVEGVVEGSIQRSGSRLRIRTRLVEARSGAVLWSEDFREEQADIFDLQDRIAHSVAGALRLRFSRRESSGYNPGAEAYTAYLEGRALWNRRTVEAVRRSVESFTRALDADPNFAPAFAGLADAYTVLGLYGSFAPAEVMPRARDAALRALKLSPTLAEAYASLGCIEAVHDWNWASAEANFRKALELNFNYATAHHWYAINLLIPMGRFAEAEESIRVARRLDPLAPAICASVGLVHYFRGEAREAVACHRKALELDHGFAMAHFFLGQALLAQGEPEEALEHFRRALELYGASSNIEACRGVALARSGDREGARKILADLLETARQRYVSPYDFACLQLALGDRTSALEHLRQAAREKAYLMVYLTCDPLLEQIRNEVEVKQLAAAIWPGGEPASAAG